jgi:hypothetical protein
MYFDLFYNFFFIIHINVFVNFFFLVIQEKNVWKNKRY